MTGYTRTGKKALTKRRTTALNNINEHLKKVKHTDAEIKKHSSEMDTLRDKTGAAKVQVMDTETANKILDTVEPVKD